MNFVPAVVSHFCLNLSEAFLQPGNGLSEVPCAQQTLPAEEEEDAAAAAEMSFYETTTYQCSTCELEFSTEKQMEAHFRLHSDAVIDERVVSQVSVLPTLGSSK